ncbi:ABC-2 type transport system permease protein [Evansella caseinilytica]|uniref:ABC-2 type transport system permease protein n=1 Tax=Evansella caseinilytica TaxID=1503961 RepID=A0A1H3K1Y6_9BACI|nr:ABC transporter permease [Evansella caseinilytica]SDY46230.1 ABC-2 type transport system permease protein [Evansella caseinilytica]
MVNEKELWSKRRSDYWSMAIKYLRLIGNSGFLFTIYLLFVFGSYYYGQFLDWLPASFPATLFFTALLTWLTTRGRVRTFVKQGDLFFLSPRERKMSSYFRAAVFYSWLMETLYVSVVFLILAPLFLDRISPSGALLLAVLLLVSGLKLWNLAAGFEEQRIQDKHSYFFHTLIRAGLNGVALYALFSLQPVWFIGILAAVFIGLYAGYYRRLAAAHSLKWERLMRIEENTVMTFYRIANSFTDVPALQSKVRKRGWLSPLFRLATYRQQHVYRYLFSRAFVRSNDYFGIYLRLTLLGLLFIYVVRIDWGRWFIVALFAYMTALQLETLKQHYATAKMVELYPAGEKTKLASHQFWLIVLGLFQGMIFGLFAFLSINVADGFLVFGLTLIIYGYHLLIRLPKRYRAS